MLFANISSTLKTLAAIILVVLIIVSIIGAIAVLASDEGLWLLALGILICGVFSAIVCACILYGLGELIEQATIIAANTAPASSNESQTAPEVLKDTCDNCGSKTGKITRYVIKDDCGTRYRHLCTECQAKGKISDTDWLCPHCGHANPQGAIGCGKCHMLR